VDGCPSIYLKKEKKKEKKEPYYHHGHNVVVVPITIVQFVGKKSTELIMT
jgi:hypothetical protein